MEKILNGQTILITGISDVNSLACLIAKEYQKQGANIVCTGLGFTPFHKDVQDKARTFLERGYTSFQRAVKQELGEHVPTFCVDATVDESIEALGVALKEKGIKLNGLLHSIAMDKSIRPTGVKKLIEVTKDEFNQAMDISGYSLISLSRTLLTNQIMERGSSILSLSYIGAGRVMDYPYKNIGIAKAALERITIELADELGKGYDIRVNCIRFSPYKESRAGRAIPYMVGAFDHAQKNSPLGNALPEDLCLEALHLMRGGLRVTGEIRHVDGGYHIKG